MFDAAKVGFLGFLARRQKCTVTDPNGKACDTRTQEQLASLERIVADSHSRYPRAIILGHRDLSPDLNGDGQITPAEYRKQCPCFDATRYYHKYHHEGFWEEKPIYK